MRVKHHAANASEFGTPQRFAPDPGGHRSLQRSTSPDPKRRHCALRRERSLLVGWSAQNALVLLARHKRDSWLFAGNSVVLSNRHGLDQTFRIAVNEWSAGLPAPN